MGLRNLAFRLTRRTVLGALAFGASASAAGARSRPRSVIRLSCPPDAPEHLCRELVQALARYAPGYVIRRVGPEDLQPGRPGDLGLALAVLKQDPHGLSARLDRQDASGPLRIGTPVTLAASGDGLHEAIDHRYAQALIAAAPLPEEGLPASE